MVLIVQFGSSVGMSLCLIKNKKKGIVSGIEWREELMVREDLMVRFQVRKQVGMDCIQPRRQQLWTLVQV